MKHKIIHGDCLEVLASMDDGSVDAVITDPPYGMDFQSAWRIADERFDKIANDTAPFVEWIGDAARVLKPGGRLLCFCRRDVAEVFRASIVDAGLPIVSQVIWDRVVHGMGDLSASPSPQHDTIWYATKGRYEFAGKRPSSVVSVPRLAANQLVHPNEKPIQLMTKLLRSYTTDGEAVLDPFSGSGTTGVACAKTGRNFIGIEIDEGYCEIARKRIADANDHLFAGTA